MSSLALCIQRATPTLPMCRKLLRLVRVLLCYSSERMHPRRCELFLRQVGLGTLRNVGLICFSVWTLGETITSQQVGGFMVTLAGFGWFQYLQMNGLAEVAGNAKCAGAASVEPPQQLPATGVHIEMRGAGVADSAGEAGADTAESAGGDEDPLLSPARPAK